MTTTLKRQAAGSPPSSFQKEGGSEQLHQVLCGEKRPRPGPAETGPRGRHLPRALCPGAGALPVLLHGDMTAMELPAGSFHS